MSNIDKRALREAAERAGQNDWEYVYTSDLSAPGRGYITVGGAEAIYCLNKAAGGVKQSENVLRYIAAASPETMLALLDELEAKDKRIEEEIGRANREHHRGFMMACGHLKEHSNVHYADAAEMEIAALRNRINELESAAAGKGE
ncbi:ead/Ea22-like family protein [Enterobacter hormaechei]|nr:ead/Ea22-like family protein [Enterobacter hormaechei]